MGAFRTWTAVSAVGLLVLGTASTGQAATDPPGTVTVPAVPRTDTAAAASVLHSQASTGLLVTSYRTGTWATDTPYTTTTVLRATTPGTPVVTTLPRAVASGANGDALLLYGVSGARTAIPEWQGPGLTRPALVLRRGAVVTAVVDTAGRRIEGVAASGPFTVASVAGTLRYVTPDGVARQVFPEAGPYVAMDGPYAAYQDSRGQIQVSDLTRSTGTRTPLLRTTTCPIARPGTTGCAARFWLSAGRLIVQKPASGGWVLAVSDLARRTTRTVALGERRCEAVSGRLMLCRVPSTGTVQSIDVAASPLRFRTVPGVVSSIPVAFAVNRVVWGGPPDPVDGSVTTLRTSALPVLNGVLGPPRTLGPWAKYGAVVARTGPAWEPQISLSLPLATWRFTVRSSTGRVVRTWSGRATDGEVRGVSWNARTRAGAPVPLGVYRWTLTGTGAYGAPTALSGVGPSTGTVRVVSQVSSTATLAAPEFSFSNHAMIRSRLVQTGTTRPLMGLTMTLWRRIGGGPWQLVGTGETNATGTPGTIGWTVVVPGPGAYEYQARHAADPYARSAVSNVVSFVR